MSAIVIFVLLCYAAGVVIGGGLCALAWAIVLFFEQHQSRSLRGDN